MKTPERMQQIEALFFAALERPADERLAYLAVSCAADTELLREVQSLISAHIQSGEFMNSPPYEAKVENRSDSASQLQVGRQLGQYRVLALIGRGGMGDVYLAQDTRLHRRVALKLLPARVTQDEQRLQRFEQEACAASALSHPNILTVHDIGQQDGAHYIATEFIEGKTLRQLFKQTTVDLHQVLELATQITAAFAAAHAAGIIHRDIKPENIMVRPDGYVKVLDFGLAKLTEHQASSARSRSLPNINTDPGTLMGTVDYMSPEQARGLALDTRSDIFSLGVVLYEMLAGRLPFEGETAGHLIVAILEREPLPLTRFIPDLPAELSWIVNKALRKDREERYQSMKDMMADLKSLKQEREFEIKLRRVSSSDKVSGAIAQASLASGETQNIKTNDDARKTSAVSRFFNAMKKPRYVAVALLVVLGLIVWAVIVRLPAKPAPGAAPAIGTAAIPPSAKPNIRMQSAHWWTFDEVSGEWLDTGTSANPIQAVSSAEVKKIAGRFAGSCSLSGGAIELKGNDKSFINFGSEAGQFGKRDFTVSFWFRTTFADRSSNQELLNNQSAISHGNYFSIRFSNVAAPPGRITFALGQGVNAVESGINFLSVESKRAALYDGKWHHVVAVRQGVGGKLFIDGLLDGKDETREGNGDIRVGDGVTDISNGTPLQLGASPVASIYKAGFFAGAVDDVQIFDRALSGEEVGELYGGLTVIIGNCDSNVMNYTLATGCTINDMISACATNARSHAQFVNCVARLTHQLLTDGIITAAEKQSIERCAQAGIEMLAKP